MLVWSPTYSRSPESLVRTILALSLAGCSAAATNDAGDAGAGAGLDGGSALLDATPMTDVGVYIEPDTAGPINNFGAPCDAAPPPTNAGYDANPCLGGGPSMRCLDVSAYIADGGAICSIECVPGDDRCGGGWGGSCADPSSPSGDHGPCLPFVP